MKLIYEAFSSSMPDWLRRKIVEIPDLKNWLLRNKYRLPLESIEFKEYPVPKSNRDTIKDLESQNLVF